MRGVKMICRLKKLSLQSLKDMFLAIKKIKTIRKVFNLINTQKQKKKKKKMKINKNLYNKKKKAYMMINIKSHYKIQIN